jgi:hypothetical protein
LKDARFSQKEKGKFYTPSRNDIERVWRESAALDRTNSGLGADRTAIHARPDLLVAEADLRPNETQDLAEGFERHRIPSLILHVSRTKRASAGGNRQAGQ